MTRFDELLKTLEQTARHPARAVKEAMEQTGKKAVGCFPYYTPEEIVYAAGMLPVGLWGGQTDVSLADRYLQSFCCSMMRINLEQGLRGQYDVLEAVIIPTCCDTLKCVCANWPAAVPDVLCVPLVFPQNRRTPAGLDFLVDGYRRVQAEMEALSGIAVSENDLCRAIAVYEDYRDTMKQFADLVGRYPKTLHARRRHEIIKAGYFCDKAIYTETVKALLAELARRSEEPDDGIRVVLTGILAETDALLDLFTANGIVVVADDLAQESRQFRTAARTSGSALERLAHRIVDQEGCSLLYDREKRHGAVLCDLVRDHKADAVVVCMMKFCDPEEFDFPVYREEIRTAGIPLLYLEIEQKMDSVASIHTRIQSFAEMVRDWPQAVQG